jgi:predicted ABC-type exoprotein transport system permease subunit
MKSVSAVGLGVLLSLAVGILVVFGILAPLFTRLFGLEMAGSTALPTVLLVFAAAFSFYFGGMAASYRAPSRRRLHGTLVAIIAFALSPALNLAAGNGAFPGLGEIGGSVLLIPAFLAVCVVASYVGARRGEALYAYNRKVSRRSARPR